MYCVDWKEDEPFELFGTYEEDDYQRFDAILTPCNYLHTMHDYQGDSVSPECVGDLTEQVKYLGPSHAIVYLN